MSNRCLNPLIVVNPRYKSLSAVDVMELADTMFDSQWRYNVPIIHNGHNVWRTPLDYYLTVPCGRCSSCISKYRNAWKSRLLLEYELTKKYQPNRQIYFITLTFNEEYLQKFGKNSEQDFGRSISLFIDRARKFYKERFRYWIVSEHGEKTGRFHFHGILFGSPVIHEKELQKLWKYGFVYLGVCNAKTINYVTKYLLKQLYNDGKGYTNRPILRCSRSLGIRKREKDLLRTRILELIALGKPLTIQIGSVCYALPRYFNKLCLSDVERLEILERMLNSPPDLVYNGRLYPSERDLFNALKYQYQKEISLGLSLPPRPKLVPINALRNIDFDKLKEQADNDLFLTALGVKTPDVFHLSLYDEQVIDEVQCPF